MISGLKDRHESQLKQENEGTKATVLSRPGGTHGSVKKEEAVVVKLENLKKEGKHQMDLDEEISDVESVDGDDVAEVVSPETRPRESRYSSPPEINIPRPRLVVRVEIPYRPNPFRPSATEGTSTRRTSLKRGLETIEARENIASRPRTRTAAKKQKVVQSHSPDSGGMETKLLGEKYKCSYCRANGLDCEVRIEGYSLLQSHWVNESRFSRIPNSRCRSCKLSPGARRCLFPFMEEQLAQRAVQLSTVGTRSGLQFRRDRLLSRNPDSSTSSSAPASEPSRGHGGRNGPGTQPPLPSSSSLLLAPAVRNTVDTSTTLCRRRRGRPPANPYPKLNSSTPRSAPAPTPASQPALAPNSTTSSAPSSQIVSQGWVLRNVGTPETNHLTALSLDPGLPPNETVELLRGLLAQSQETTRVVTSLLERLDARQDPPR